jgi:hypothetical protein
MPSTPWSASAAAAVWESRRCWNEDKTPMILLSTCDLLGLQDSSGRVKDKANHENTKFFDFFFVLSCFRDKGDSPYPLYQMKYP